MELKVASLNVRGLRDKAKQRELFNFLKIQDLDIVCLQETHSTVNDEKNWNQLWGAQIHFSHGDTQSKGTAILCNPKKQGQIKLNKIMNDSEGRYLMVEIESEENKMVLVNIYGTK